MAADRRLRLPGVVFRQGAVHGEPVFGRHVPLADGQQAAQPRFGEHHPVVLVGEMLVVRLIALAHVAQVLVVEEAVIALVDQLAATLRQFGKSLPRRHQPAVSQAESTKDTKWLLRSRVVVS